MLNYSETQNQMVYNLTNLDRQERYREDVKTLHKCGIDIIKVNYFVNLYLADINKLITQQINNVKDIWAYQRRITKIT